MKILKKIVTNLVGMMVCCACFAPPIYAAEVYPKREMRSTWVASLGIDWPSSNSHGATAAKIKLQKEEAVAILDRLKADGFNSVFLHVRPYGDRIYAKNSWKDPQTGITYTAAEPWSTYLTGGRGTAPAASANYDPLEYWIEEAHKRGMELHAWVNPYRHNGATTLAEDSAVKDWIIKHVYTNSEGKTTTFYVFNPALPQTIARIQNVCRVLTGNYDIDGIVFDDYFYPEGMGKVTDSSAADYTNYQAYKNGGGTMSIGDWRRDNVNRMVSEVNDAIKAIKPWVRFGISPAGAGGAGRKASDGIPPLSDYCSASDWVYSSICCDALAWLRNKSVDYVSPQLYWLTTHSSNPFGPMTEWWSIVADKFGRHHYASHSISVLNTTNSEANRQDIVEQVRLSRANNHGVPNGTVLYSTKTYMNNADLQKLIREEVFSKKAVVPAMTWYDAADPGKVKNVKLTGTTLTWNALDNMRYIVYAVPTSVTEEKAASVDGGMRAKYIVDITYTNSLTVPSGDYRYYVAPLDRYGNEWAATEYGNEDEGEYEPQLDPDSYPQLENASGSNTIQLSLTSLWMHGPTVDPISHDIELHRDMVAHSTAETGDVVYLISRSTASTSASTELIRYDANTGKHLKSLQLTYDADFDPGYYPGNGLIVDNSNQLLTHTLTLANGMLSIAKIDPTTGACTTVFSEKTELRVDHLDVYGEAGGDANWYVVAPSTTGVTRWTMAGTTVKKKEFMAISGVGNAPRVHCINANKFWLSGQGMHGTLYKFGTDTPLATMKSHEIEPGSISASAIATFSLGDEQMMFYQYNYAKDGIRWALARGADFKNNLTGAKQMWVLPTAGLGTSTMTSGDFGAPVSILTSAPVDTQVKRAAPVTKSARLYAYSPGNGLVGYNIEQRIITGVEDVAADGELVFRPVNTSDRHIDMGVETSRFTIYDAAGRLVEQGTGAISALPLSPGIYVVNATVADTVCTAKVAVD